jgi:hypothetical protein
MVPSPVTLQAKVGCDRKVAPNRSRAVAVNCWVAERLTVTAVGATVMLVRVWSTFTVTELVVVRLPVSLTVACSV